MNRLATFFVTFLISASCTAAELRTGNVTLLQPDHDLQQKGLDVRSLANFIKEAESVSERVLQPTTLPPSNGFLVMAVREGNQTNVWLDMTPALPPTLEQQLVEAIRQLPAVPVANGTVIFALQLMINGATPPAKQIPRPPAWQPVINSLKEPLDMERLVLRVWPYPLSKAPASAGRP